MDRCLLIGRRFWSNVSFVKLFIFIFVLAISSNVLLAEDWKTIDGTVYKDVRVVRVEDDAITIIYKDGGALVPLFKLPHDLQDRFDYDPAKAKAAAEARSKSDVENAKALQAEIEMADKIKHDQQVKDAANLGLTNSAAK
jgi:hypothetical protein